MKIDKILCKFFTKSYWISMVGLIEHRLTAALETIVYFYRIIIEDKWLQCSLYELNESKTHVWVIRSKPVPGGWCSGFKTNFNI